MASIRHGIATITRHRLERRHAFTNEMGAALFGAIERFDRGAEVRAVLSKRAPQWPLAPARRAARPAGVSLEKARGWVCCEAR